MYTGKIKQCGVLISERTSD